MFLKEMLEEKKSLLISIDALTELAEAWEDYCKTEGVPNIYWDRVEALEERLSELEDRIEYYNEVA